MIRNSMRSKLVAVTPYSMFIARVRNTFAKIRASNEGVQQYISSNLDSTDILSKEVVQVVSFDRKDQ